MELFTYLAEFGTHPRPGAGHVGLYMGLAVMAAFLVRSAYKDLTRPDSVPADAGPDPRLPLFRETVASLWLVALSCLAGWLAAGGSLEALGFRLPTGTGGWLGNGIALLAGGALLTQAVTVSRSEEVRQQFAAQLDEAEGYDWIRPGSRPEYRWFQVMAVTAGITEEVIFRGFLIGTLALWLPAWAAATASVLIFVGAHVYQGVSGMRRILPISLALTTIFLLTGSLLPVIVLHALVDVAGGAMMWRLRGYRTPACAPA